MVKGFLRNILIFTYILFVLPKIIPGVEIDGGFMTFFMGGVGLALMFGILKPILNLISIPANLLTLGLFSLVINAVILYLLTVLVSDISITKFIYPKTELGGFVIPKIAFNTFFAYMYTAIVLSGINGAMQWMRK
jgi:putative membrane protein